MSAGSAWFSFPGLAERVLIGLVFSFSAVALVFGKFNRFAMRILPGLAFSGSTPSCGQRSQDCWAPFPQPWGLLGSLVKEPGQLRQTSRAIDTKWRH
jgi:hypothetical protein